MFKNDVDWSPTLHLGHQKLAVRSASHDERDKRAETRKRKREELEQEIQDALVDTNVEVVNDQDWDDGLWDKEVQTECTGELVGDFFDQEEFIKNDQKVKYYTGLPNGELLMEVFKLVVPFPGNKEEWYWKSFISTLMKLRLNCGLQDLAYRLQVSLSTMTRRYQEMIDMMYVRLNFLIFWPERENLIKTMPLCFRPVYGVKVVAIIDCYEVRIEKPSNLVAKGATWSQYKQANTVKILIGISPQGVTTFVSDSWGGRVSDKHLTRESGLLKKLLPGDILLADRGFDIAEEVGLMQASLEIPAFTKGLTQLSPVDIEKTRKLANLRIHIERVIGATRQRFSILSSTLPIQYMKSSRDDIPVVDKIIRICSALNNLCVSTVPFT